MARILFFGRLRDIAGPELNLDLTACGPTVAGLRARLAEINPALAEALSARGVRVAVNQEIVSDEADISNAAEIAFMPPMSGG